MAYTHLFSALTSHIETIIVTGGYPFLFLTVILEGIPLIGTLVPGHVAVIAAGFLARMGILNIWWVLTIALVAAIFGDFAGFCIGRKYGMPFIDKLRGYFFLKDSHIEKANELLSKHTAKSMIIARVTPLTRALMPFVVGTSSTPVHKFWIYNIIGAIGWVGSSVLIGYVFGAGYHAASGYFGKVIMVAIVLAILIMWGYRFVNVRFHIFRRYELFVLGLNILALYALARTIQDAWAATSFMAGFDVWVNLFMTAHVTPVMVTLSTWIGYCGNIGPVTAVSIVCAVILALRKKWRSTAIVLISLGSTAFCIGFMKELFLRARPENALLVLPDPSFPSGHAAIAAAFFTVAGYLIATHVKGWFKRELLIVVCVIAAIIVGLSRIILGVHWASDVIAGWSLGIFLATASVLLVRYVGMLVTKKK